MKVFNIPIKLTGFDFRPDRDNWVFYSTNTKSKRRLLFLGLNQDQKS